jgi:hypothetical protein
MAASAAPRVAAVLMPVAASVTPWVIKPGWTKNVAAVGVECSVPGSKPKVNPAGVTPVEGPASDIVALPESVGGAVTVSDVPALSDDRFSAALIGALVWKVDSVMRYSPSAN